MAHGCKNRIDMDGLEVTAYCPYYERTVCRHEEPAALTSAEYGAHPDDCPLALKKEIGNEV